MATYTSETSSPQFQEFTKAFLVKHQQLVDSILKESCANAIEAITRQTCTLMNQENVAGAEYTAREPKFEPKLESKPAPSIIGIRKAPTISFAPQVEEADALVLQSDTPPSWSPPKLKSNYSKLSIVGDLSLTPQQEGRPPSIVKQGSALFATPAGTRKTYRPPKPSEALARKSKARATVRKSVARSVEGMPNVQRGLFADGEAMKEKLRLAITQPVYDVSNYYHKTGTCQAVARSSLFENTTLVVIALNAIWISIDVDLNDADIITNAHPVFQVADNLFCLYFFFELIVRFCAFKTKSNALKDAWFVFDTCMCLLMVFDTWLLPMVIFCFANGSTSEKAIGDTAVLKGFRLVRLVRMARVLKLLNALPELMVVIKGLFVATRAVSCTVLLMLLIIYVFAITFRQMTSGTDLGKSHFNSVPTTMRYLLVLGTMPDLYDYVLTIWNEGIFFAMMFLFFVLIVTITVMNMLVGVLVGVVNTVASVEKEQLMVHFVKDNLLSLLKVMHDEDRNEDQQISKDEFRRLIQNADAIRSFTAMGVDVVGLVDLADFIFQDGQKIAFSDFMDLVMQLRGSNQATVKDIVDLRRFITMEFNAVLHALDLIPHDTHPTEEVSKVVSRNTQNLANLEARKTLNLEKLATMKTKNLENLEARKTLNLEANGTASQVPEAATPISAASPEGSQFEVASLVPAGSQGDDGSSAPLRVAAGSCMEEGILAPLVENADKDYSHIENGRKKKIKRKNTNSTPPQANDSPLPSLPETLVIQE